MLEEDEEYPAWVEAIGKGPSMVLLVIATLVLFWALAVICEERFVPALNVICDLFNIPDDVAGATLMAAGASSPEMFSSFVALFITHTSLGVGTVVGSEIFNHLMICAGSVAYAKGGVLALDRKIVARESFFYFLGLVLLLLALSRKRTADGEHIVIHWTDGAYLSLSYVAYVVVCAKFGAISDWVDSLYVAKKAPSADGFLPVAAAPADEKLLSSSSGTAKAAAATEMVATTTSSGAAAAALSGSSSVAASISSSSGTVTAARPKLPRYRSSLLKSIHDHGTDLKRSHLERLEREPSRNFLDLASDPESGASTDALPRGSSGSSYGATVQVGATASRPPLNVAPSFLGMAPHHSASTASSSMERSSSAPTPQRPSFAQSASLRNLNASAVQLVHKLDLAMSGTHRELEETVEVGTIFACYMFRANRHYARARLSWRAFELRWCVVRLDANELDSYRARTDAAADVPFWTRSHGARKYALRGVEPLDRERCILELELVAKGADAQPGADPAKKPPIHLAIFLAPTIAVFDAFVAKAAECAEAAASVAAAKQMALISEDKEEEAGGGGGGAAEKGSLLEEDDEVVVEDDDDMAEESLIQWPAHDAGPLAVFFHVFLFPAKLALHLTVLDVRLCKTPTKRDAFAASLACLGWLVALSLWMCSCCELLGDILGMSDAVIGITFSAVGTSLPNLIASMVVAQKGLGNMAVSNALGSNTFNIFIGLGVPWLMYTLTVGPYDALPAEDVVTPVLILLVTLASFITLLFFTDFTLGRVHGLIFTAIYVIFVVWAIRDD